MQKANATQKPNLPSTAVRHRKEAPSKRPFITKPVIRRMCRRAGIKRISGMIYEDIRALLKVFVENTLVDANTYAEYARRKTITANDILYALKRHGQTVYGY